MTIHKDYETAMDSKYYLSSRLGAPTSPQTANQIKELGNMLNQGMKNVEVGSVSPEVFETIPKQHFDEMKRMGKLTGAETTLHGPMVDIAGLGQQGWTESQRLTSEKQIESVIDRGYKLNPEGNIPITLHAGTIPVYEWQKAGLKEGEKRAMGIVNQETGQIQSLRYEERKYLGRKEPVIWTPEKRLESLNQTEWDQEKLRLMSLQKNLDEVRDRQFRVMAQNAAYAEKVRRGLPMSERETREYSENLRNINAFQTYVNEINENMRSGFQELHNRFETFFNKKDPSYVHYKEGPYKVMLENFERVDSDIGKVHRRLMDIGRRYEKTRNPTLAEEYYRIDEQELRPLLNYQTESMMKDIGNMPAPELWKPVDDFAIEKGSETIANVALNAYKKYGKNTPIISLENVYPEMPLSRAESLRKVIEDGRRKFVEKLSKEKKISKEQAEKVAEKLVGATWDLGHINMLRRFGYSEKDILEETKKISPFVKHVHITDNFGFADTHLPPGMGNVTVKEAMEKLEKEGYAGKAIVEAGGFPRFFETSPQPYILEEMGSPLYSMEAPPYWHEIRDTYGRYYMGYGNILPQQHHDFYGAGFSTVPRELGGEAGSPERGRFAAGAGEQAEY